MCFANDAVAKEVGGKKEQLLQQNFREIKAWKVGNLLGAAETTIVTGLTQQAEQRVTTSFGKEAYLRSSIRNLYQKG